ncbi:hypothetical protein NFI96_012597 [Prochilodus magdalenae]|nr:hypothetical protein NFI96_012597 [Prochilodus magdalenae]
MVYLEFNRIIGRNLKDEFFNTLDALCPGLMELFKKKRGLTGQILTDLLQQIKTADPTAIRGLVLRGLPVILGDDSSKFFRSTSNLDDADFLDIPVGVLCFEDNEAQNQASTSLNPSRARIVLEGCLVMDELTNLPQAICLLFGLIYALHLEYPKCMKNTFSFIQQIMPKENHKPYN